MALSFPVSCWVALVGEFGELGGMGYVRETATFELTEDGATAANAATILWPQATGPWGTIFYVELYDAPTAGRQIGVFEPVSLVTVAQYERVEIPAAGFSAIVAPRVPSGFGTYTWGVDRYATNANWLSSPGAGIGNVYGAGPYGYGAYERTQQGVLLLKVWAPVQLCGGEPADWVHGPVEIA